MNPARPNPLGTERLIDSHLHIWDVERPDRPYPWTPDPHPLELLLPLLEANGVDRVIQVTPSIMGYDNDYGIRVADAHPDRVGVFARFDHAADDIEGRLATLMRIPAVEGIRLTFFGPSAATPGALLGLGALWEACEEQSVPVAVFAPDALADLATVAERHPGLRIILDHLGLAVFEGSPDPFGGWHHLPALAAAPNLVTKISTLVEASREQYPFRDVHDRLAEARELFGIERLLWGSNHPVVTSACSYAESLTFLLECDVLGPDDLEWLAHRAWSRFMAGGA